MLPLSGGIPARRFPLVTVAIMVANLAVWILYELPHVGTSIYHAASWLPCASPAPECANPNQGA